MDTQPLPYLKEFVFLIKELGFPIFVALWVLIITTRQTKLLTRAINRLTIAFERADIKVSLENNNS